jgi:hypothetical protein
MQSQFGWHRGKSIRPYHGTGAFFDGGKEPDRRKEIFSIKAGSKPCAGIPGGDAFDLKGTEI